VVAFGLFLFVDLLAKLAGVTVGPFDLSLMSLGPFGGDVPFERVLGFIWNGVVIGLVIGLASIGLSLTYSILNFANFAHGDYLTAGAFSGWAVAYIIAGIGGAYKIGETAVYLLTGLQAVTASRTPTSSSSSCCARRRWTPGRTSGSPRLLS